MATEVDFANAVKGKLDGKAPTGHNHDDRYYTEGEADGRFVQGSDPRLTDARTPTAHSHPISGVTGLQTALDGKQAAGSYVRTVNGTAPDVAGNVAVVGGGGAATLNPQAFERFRTMKAFGRGRLRMAVVGDSTGNAVDEWVRLFTRRWGGTVPDGVSITYRAWDGSAWGAELIDRTPGVVRVYDTFTRTGSVAGSSPDIGPAWATGAPTDWNANGTLARPDAANATISSNLGSVDMTATVNLSVVTTGRGVTQGMRVYLGSISPTTNSGTWLSFNINASGVPSVLLYKTVSGTNSEMVASKPIAGIVNNSAVAANIAVVMSLTGNMVTVTITCAGQTTTLSGTLAAGDAATFGPYVRVTANTVPANAADFGVSILDIDASGVSQVGSDLFSVWNGSISGGSLATFDAPTRATMFGGTPFDVVVINVGHNYLSDNGSTFTAAVAAWVAAWKGGHPESAVLITSQNPQFTPATGVATHAARQAALRLWAVDNGYSYVPVFEAFASEPDGGLSLVKPDGVHPTGPEGGATTGHYGSVRWTETLEAALAVPVV